MTVLSSSSNLVFNNCQLIDHSAAEESGETIYLNPILQGINERKGRRILQDASLPGALHDSGIREVALRDIPETEQDDFVDRFIVWALLADRQFVMWWKGPKSTLAQMCAEKAEEQLAATFFFSRLQGVNDPKRFFTTISHQLATHFPLYAALVEGKLRRDPYLVTKSLKVQFRELISVPFQEPSAGG